MKTYRKRPGRCPEKTLRHTNGWAIGIEFYRNIKHTRTNANECSSFGIRWTAWKTNKNATEKFGHTRLFTINFAILSVGKTDTIYTNVRTRKRNVNMSVFKREYFFASKNRFVSKRINPPTTKTKAYDFTTSELPFH